MPARLRDPRQPPFCLLQIAGGAVWRRQNGGALHVDAVAGGVDELGEVGELVEDEDGEVVGFVEKKLLLAFENVAPRLSIKSLN